MALSSLRAIAILLASVLSITGTPASAQTSETNPLLRESLPESPAESFARQPGAGSALAPKFGEMLRLAAKLTEDSESIPRGLVWRVFEPEPGADGKLALVATATGGETEFRLAPGSYLVHAAFGRAGATKRITMARNARNETLVLDAGGLKLNAVLEGNAKIPPKKLRFAIHAGEEDEDGEKPLILPNVRPGAVVRLNAGMYHVVSNYGSTNAIVRGDIRVEAGKLTEATLEHNAALVNIKLVRQEGGEAIADTAWSILTASGEVVRESVGAYATQVLAAGDYTAIARNKERIFQRDFSVKSGEDVEVEVVSTQAATNEAN